MIGIKPVGDWKRAYLFFRKASSSKVWAETADKVVKRAAEIALEEIQKGIARQGLIDTGFYLSNVSVWKLKSTPMNPKYFSGASNRKIHTPSGLILSDLAVIHEYGTKTGIPARPVYRPAQKALLKILPKYCKEVLNHEILGMSK